MDTITPRDDDPQEIDLSVHPSSSSRFGLYVETSSNLDQRQLASNATNTTSSQSTTTTAPQSTTTATKHNSVKKTNLCHWSNVTWKKFTPIQKLLLITLTICILSAIAIVIIQCVFTFLTYPGKCKTFSKHFN